MSFTISGKNKNTLGIISLALEEIFQNNLIFNGPCN